MMATLSSRTKTYNDTSLCPVVGSPFPGLAPGCPWRRGLPRSRVRENPVLSPSSSFSEASYTVSRLDLNSAHTGQYPSVFAVSAKLFSLAETAETGGDLVQCRWRLVAGEALGVSGKTVDKCENVLTKGTDKLIAAVDRGQVSADAAAQIADLPERIHL